VPVSGTS